MRVSATALSSALHADLQNVIDARLTWAPDSTPREVACYILKETLLKKFNETDKPSVAACELALEKFRAVNERCGTWSLQLENTLDEYLINGVKKTLYDFWYSPSGPIVSDFNQVISRGRAGPGASVQARDSDLYTKMFDGPLTGTGDLPYVWDKVVSNNPTWCSAQQHRKGLYGTIEVESSNYSFVKKTSTIARGICTEPSINMWMQLGLGSLLEERLLRFFNISLSEQPDVNRVLARRGSVANDLATIDLESASDSLGRSMLLEILPRDMFSWLDVLRCKTTKLPSGELVALNMISTMGNGYTFPLESVVFSAVVKSVYEFLDIPFHGRGQAASRSYGVFGDDIIVDHRAVRHVLRVLYLLGFKTNTDKTFVEGPFRESCGADYFLGENVRGVYIKSLNTEQDLFAAFNSLVRWSSRFVPLDRTLALLLKGIYKPITRLVPFDEDDSAGIHAPQRAAIRAGYPVTRHGSIMYRPSVPQEWKFYILGDACWTFRDQVKRTYNPSGLLLSFLAGSIRGCTVTLRQRVTKYTTRRKWTPSWDYLPPRPLEDPRGRSRHRRLTITCERALSAL